MEFNIYFLHITVTTISDLIISGLVTNGTAKIYCRSLILALFYSTKLKF